MQNIIIHYSSPLPPQTPCLVSPLSNIPPCLQFHKARHSTPSRSHTMSGALSRGKAATSIYSSLSSVSARMSPRHYSYSGLVVTSFLLAALLPFQFASNGARDLAGRQTLSRHAHPELQSRARTSFPLPVCLGFYEASLSICYSLCFIPPALSLPPPPCSPAPPSPFPVTTSV